MQTISVPYRTDDAGAAAIADRRRIYAAALRTAYANATSSDGKTVPEKDLRHLVKARFAGQRILDAWSLHCATLEGRDLRKARPDERMIFGSRRHFERRQAGLISRDEWRAHRLRPFCTRGDRLYLGNRHFRLSPDASHCRFTIYGREVVLDLPAMTGNAGVILRQAAALAAAKAINVTFRIDASHLHITIDPQDLPNHSEWRRPIPALPGRAFGIDLNPDWVGISVVENTGNVLSLDETRVLDHALVQLRLDRKASSEQVREALAALCGRIIDTARHQRAGVIAIESGLGKLRSGGRNRALNWRLNAWARTILVHMLTRKARLAGLKVVEVWSGYSTTIGNLAFALRDACAAATEIARRGLAAGNKNKELLPALSDEVLSRLRKDEGVPTAAMPQQPKGWGELHRAIKAAKLGVRRPHPRLKATDPGPRPLATETGYAVHRLGLKHRPGLIARPSPQAAQITRMTGTGAARS
ncbi:hypothetical protein ACLF3G_26290 [Falsiroseomonas sp. HC035]|uniref:hypothetical protein n=1 Tax=Falsiroseomonas sp. HC035 TaxID=3390999 RepID=UPI003D31CF04